MFITSVQPSVGALDQHFRDEKLFYTHYYTICASYCHHSAGKGGYEGGGMVVIKHMYSHSCLLSPRVGNCLVCVLHLKHTSIWGIGICPEIVLNINIALV